jgi:hypothetical protein
MNKSVKNQADKKTIFIFIWWLRSNESTTTKNPTLPHMLYILLSIYKVQIL